MRVGVQFRGTVQANRSVRWFTFRWPQEWHVTWHVVPSSPNAGAPQVEWDVEAARGDSRYLTYWITVKNLTNQNVNVEGRYAVLN
ncbi:MAG: hypothetical protein ACLFUB_17090 [Cyclobacteriaceae bacterium]